MVAWGAKRQPQWYALKDGWWWAVVDDKLRWDAATAATAGASLRVVVQYFYDPDDQWEVRPPLAQAARSCLWWISNVLRRVLRLRR